MARVVALILFTAQILLPTASGMIVFENVAAFNSGSNVSSTLDNFGGTPGYISADNFSLTSAATITNINWWGITDFGDEEFTVTFYDDAGGLPGSVLLATDVSYTSAAAFSDALFYEAALGNAFAATAGTTYWVSVFNGAPDANFDWIVATDGGGDGSAQRRLTDPWGPSAGNLGFQLVSAVPEPTSPVLWILGVVGMALARRRVAPDNIHRAV